MNPIDKFEGSARRIWASDLPLDDKAARLLKLSEAIRRYVIRLETSKSTIVQKDDTWGEKSFDRARMYLETLARDTRQVAFTCQREAITSEQHQAQTVATA